MGSSLITALSLAAVLVVGMALALTKFCFVVTVLGARSGNLSPARCVVGLSLLIALSFLVLAQWHGGETMPIYNPRLAVVAQLQALPRWAPPVVTSPDLD